MKKITQKLTPRLILITALLLSAVTLAVVGCKQPAPTKFDQLFNTIKTNPPAVPFTIQYATNFVTQTNTVTRTNELTLTNVVTGERTLTNTVTQTATLSTNPIVVSIIITNPPTYDYAPNANADKLKAGAGLIGNLIAPGVGGPIAVGIMGLLTTGYAWLRGNKQKDTSAALAQEVETGREVIKAFPGGQKYDEIFTQWLADHQKELGTVKQVTSLLDNNVSNSQAVGTASAIINSGLNAIASQQRTATVSPPPVAPGVPPSAVPVV